MRTIPTKSLVYYFVRPYNYKTVYAFTTLSILLNKTSLFLNSSFFIESDNQN